jgi:DNA replication protein DnaC
MAACEKCGGSGWIFLEEDGILTSTQCSCVSATRTQTHHASSRIPPLYENKSFEDFLLPRDNPLAHSAMAKVMVDVRAYTREFPAAQRPGLLFVGDPGVGKTHLAVAVLKSLIDRGFEGVFFDYQNLLDRIRSSYSEMSGASDREAYRTVLDTDIVLLDDLGSHRVTDWVEDTVTSILTWRCNNKKPTIVTTNLPDPDAGMSAIAKPASPSEKPYMKDTLEHRIGMRARSRLFEMCRVIRMPQVADYRIRSASGR